MNAVFSTKQDGVGFAIGGGSSDISHGEGLGIGNGSSDIVKDGITKMARHGGGSGGITNGGGSSCINGGGSGC